jgi:alkyl hydroperoxide reductase subunit F
MYDLIIIGGGPAGLTASIYAIRKRLNVLTIAKDLGGKTTLKLSIPWAEDYHVIRGLEIVNKFKQELEYLDFAYKHDEVTQLEKSDKGFIVHTANGESFETKSVIVATGVRMEGLNVPGEKEFFFKGLCYSAVSYAPLFIEKDAIVIGDGELALRSTAELATVAKKVQAVGLSKDMLTTDLGKKLLEADNVNIYPEYEVTQISGNGFADSITAKSPEGQEISLKMDGAFVEKALQPNTEFLKGILELDDQNRIKVDCLNQTKTPGIFAAGDVTSIYAEQVLVAIGEGAKAALSAYDYLLRYN